MPSECSPGDQVWVGMASVTMATVNKPSASHSHSPFLLLTHIAMATSPLCPLCYYGNLTPTPSGAYYSGIWSANQKHGRGTLVLQNGSTLHCLFHHDVLISSSHDPAGVAADHRTLPLRTKTPLTTLIGW